MSRTGRRLRPSTYGADDGAADDGSQDRETEMPKYLLGTTFEPGADPTPMEEWTEEEVTAHLNYYEILGRKLVESGELVDSTILTGPDRAKVVRSGPGGEPVVTDGPFQEFKEWLAGYLIVEVAEEARALEIAALVSAVPGRGGVPTAQPTHVRQVMEEGPADAQAMGEYLDTARGT
jgi:hypothetical protein